MQQSLRYNKYIKSYINDKSIFFNNLFSYYPKSNILIFGF